MSISVACFLRRSLHATGQRHVLQIRLPANHAPAHISQALLSGSKYTLHLRHQLAETGALRCANSFHGGYQHAAAPHCNTSSLCKEVLHDSLAETPLTNLGVVYYLSFFLSQSPFSICKPSIQQISSERRLRRRQSKQPKCQVQRRSTMAPFFSPPCRS